MSLSSVRSIGRKSRSELLCGGSGSTAGIAVGTSPITSGLPVILQESTL